MAEAIKARPVIKPAAARLKAAYFGQFSKELQKDLNLKNINEVPRLEKIVVNMGLGRIKEDKKAMSAAEEVLKKITGQQPIYTISKKSIASFKLREGQRIGLKVTLRDERMYEFMDRFINIVLPRLRDFHGVSAASFDANGNYSVGLSENSVFPELSFEETSNQGLQIVFVINAKEKEHSRSLLEKFGMPFEKQQLKPEKQEAAPPPEVQKAIDDAKAEQNAKEQAEKEAALSEAEESETPKEQAEDKKANEKEEK